MKMFIRCPDCGSDNCPYNRECIQCSHAMPGEEQALMDDIVNLWNKFVKMEPLHPDDTIDFKNAVHSMQNILASRVCLKMGMLGFSGAPLKKELNNIQEKAQG